MVNYVKLFDEVKKINLIDQSYSGGKHGMEVTWKVLQEYIPLININGIM